MSREPAAFMSYVRFDDQHDDGQLSQFRERLSAEVQVQTGEGFVIFQDRNGIAWGQNWQARINETLDAVTLLIPIITPSFFRSPPCCEEVERFLARERELGRQDLILPVYYVSTPELDDPDRRDLDELARVLAARQFADWRELRFEPFTSPVVRKALAQLASRMRDTFWQQPSAPSSRPGGSRRAATRAAEAEATASEPAAAAQSAAKTEPPTHVVDAFPHRGDFTTISAAIAAARPGDRILVRPGLYQEGLVIDKPLELLGDGPVPDIQVQAQGTNVLLFKASLGRVANLTLRQAGGSGNWFGVDITQGRLELEGCDIASQRLSCVAIRNGVDPRLRRNTIHDSKQSGVFVYDDGLGTLEDNDLSANGLHGVEIRTGGNPTLRRNQIHDNQQGGVFVQKRGLGRLEDNNATANGLAGVSIKTGSNPILRRNQIRANKASGVLVYDDGLGTLEDNEISANSYSGVEIRNGGNPTVRRNQIHDNQQNGVFVQDRGLGRLEDNDITASGLHGVEIKTSGNPTVRRNRVNRNTYQAVSVHEGGRGVIEDNDLTGNRGGRWHIAKESERNVKRTGNRE
jgi:parallel beta-helix repeat protein